MCNQHVTCKQIYSDLHHHHCDKHSLAEYEKHPKNFVDQNTTHTALPCQTSGDQKDAAALLIIVF